MEKQKVKSAEKGWTKVGEVIADKLAAEYAAIKEAEAALADRKAAMQSQVRSLMKDGVLETSSGTFRIETRKSYDWSLDAVKDIMPRLWQGFVKPDASLLRKRAETVDEVGAALVATATVKETEAFTFR